MGLLTVKGRGNKLELCSKSDITFDELTAELNNLSNDKNGFFEESDVCISYSGITLSYNEEMKLEKEIKRLFGDGAILERKHRLSTQQIRYSLLPGETTCLVVEKSLRSGETVTSRGDLLIYGDVNPGAKVCAYGNITVMGALRGVAHITGKGRVYATYMQPSQIKIGKVYSYNKTGENVAAACAMAENGEIILQCL